MRTLGVFDSGIGGLTVLRCILKRNAYDRIVYFGDTARVPYGSKDRETIIRYAKQDVAFLQSQNVDEIVVACGTVSANALDALRQSCTIPIRGVIDAAAERAAQITHGTIGLIGTEATVRSGIYPKKIGALAPSAAVVSAACPLFVPLVENGFFAFENEIVRKSCEFYLKPLKDAKIDTLILGCTHYPMLRPFIDDYFEGKAALIDQGEALAETLPTGTVRDENRQITLFVSDGAAQFEKNMGKYLPDVSVAGVTQFTIE